MKFTVRVIVSTRRDRAVDRALKGAVARVGAVLQQIDRDPARGGPADGILTVRIAETRQLHAVVRSIEQVRGVAVLEVMDLRPVEPGRPQRRRAARA